MTDRLRLPKPGSFRFSFTGKIILTAILLLAFSQSLGTLLSTSTFETLILKTRITRYEILGKDLRRRIQQSLRFGKRLEQFFGMEKLVAPVYRQADDIDEIFLLSPEGSFFFFSNRTDVSPEMESSRQMEDDRLFHIQPPGEKTNLPHAFFSAIGHSPPINKTYQGKHYILLAIPPIQGNKAGILGLAFQKSLLDDQKYELLSRTGKKLALSLFLTILLMTVMIHFFFTKPCQKQVENHLLSSDIPDDNSRGLPSASNELTELSGLISSFQQNMHDAENTLRQAITELRSQTDDPAAIDSIDEMTHLLKGKPDEID